MSSSNSTFTSTSYSYSSSSSSAQNGQQQTSTGHRTLQQTSTDPSGTTTIHSASQNLGQPIVQESRTYDAQGRELVGNGGSSQSRIEDVSDREQAQRDREYEERMEEEYAKREGGA